MKREFLQSLQVGQENLPKDVIDAIMAENGRDIQNAKEQAKLWQDRYNEAVSAHEEKLAEMEFSARLTGAISAAGGRNAKAITALLDTELLKQSQNPEVAIGEAIEKVKAENDYLFEIPGTPPPYARGTGAATGVENHGPQTLAGALKERFEQSRH